MVANAPAGTAFLTEATGLGLLTPEKFGALGGGADDTAAIVAMLAAAPVGSRVHFARLYKVTSPVTVSKQITMTGEIGRNDSLTPPSGLYTDSATTGALLITAHGCHLRDMGVTCTATTPTAGSGIKFTAGRHARMNNVTVRGFYNNVEFADGFYWRMRDCNILSPVNYGLYVHNTSPSTDWGDELVEGCIFTCDDTARNAAIAVRWEAGGGLRFENNKINGGLNPNTLTAGGTFTDGVSIYPTSGTNTADIFIVGNSIENCSGANLHLHGPTAPSGSVAGYTVTANEFGFGATGSYGVKVDPGVAGAILSGTIANNAFTSLTNGIYCKNAQLLHIGRNTYYSVTTPLTIDTGNLQVSCDPQMTNGDGVIFQDLSVNSDQNGAGSKAELRHEYQRELPDFSAVPGTYKTLWRIAMSSYSGVSFDVKVSGNASGGSPYSQRYSRIATWGAGGPATIATVGTDATLPATNAPADVVFDTGIVAGEIHVRVRVNPAATGAADVAGRMTLRVEGILAKLTRGA